MTESEYWQRQLIDELEHSMAFHKRSAEMCDFALKCFNLLFLTAMVIAADYIQYFMISRGL